MQNASLTSSLISLLSQIDGDCFKMLISKVVIIFLSLTMNWVIYFQPYSSFNNEFHPSIKGDD